jgi:Protein of unknown function (DUF3617)
VAEGGGLLNRYRLVKAYRGFESLRLRHPSPLRGFGWQVSAAAESLMEAGQWTVTQSMVMNGNVIPPQSKARCITPEQADDVAKTFGPVSGTINSTCEAPTSEISGKTLKWRLQCRGQLDMDVAGDFNFDTPHHYTATITSKGKMAGALISDIKTEVVGERVGDCAK